MSYYSLLVADPNPNPTNILEKYSILNDSLEYQELIDVTDMYNSIIENEVVKNKLFPNIESFVKTYELIMKDNGRIYRSINKFGKFDSYNIGGKYSGLLQLKNDCKELDLYKSLDYKLYKDGVNCCKIKDIDYTKYTNNTIPSTHALIKDNQWYSLSDIYNIICDKHTQVVYSSYIPEFMKDNNIIKLSWGDYINLWDHIFKKILSSIDPEYYITIYYCHI